MDNKTRKLIFVFALFIPLLLQAQPYKNAVGIRGGYSSGFTYKQFLHRNYAIDMQALYSEHGFHLHALYDYQFSPYDRDRLFYYAGAGVFGGNWKDEFSIGVAACIGAEYVFHSAPVSIGAEWKPALNVIKVFDYAIPDLAIHFRVMLSQ